MSAAQNYFSGTGKAPVEKSKFVQTCNRLSLFLREKGNLRDLSFDITAKSNATGIPDASPVINPTVDLLSYMNTSSEKASQAEKPESILPQYVILDSSSCELEDSTIKASSCKAVTKPKTAQMTIFYGGEILVLEDVPADRARDLILMVQNSQNRKIENQAELASTPKPPSHDSGSKERIPAELQTKGSDLPIARRASLHKFLAKRKDRATVRAPYQVHHASTASSSGKELSFDLNN